MRALFLSLLVMATLQAETRQQQFILPNGLTVLLLETHEHPLVRARIHVSLGPEDRPQTCPDLPERFLHLLESADPGGRKPGEWHRDLEAQGIQSWASTSPAGLDWHLLARSRDQDRSLGLLADLLLRPVMDPSAWNPSCGATWEDAQAFQRSTLRPDRAILILHGDLGLEQAKQLALLSLGTWTTGSGKVPAPAPPAISFEVQALRALLARPGGPLTQRYSQEELDHARRAWLGHQSLLSLDPEAQMAQALQEALGQAPRLDRMNALTVEDLNR